MTDWTRVMMQTRVKLLLPHNVEIAPEDGAEWSEPFSLDADDLAAGIRPDLWLTAGVCRVVTPKAASKPAAAADKPADSAPPVAAGSAGGKGAT